MSLTNVPIELIETVELEEIPVGYGRASIIYNNHIYIHGGYNIKETRMNDLFKINIENMKITKLDIIGDNPCLDCHKACLINGKMIFSMGGDGFYWNSDIRELDLDTLIIKKIDTIGPNKPERRAGHFMIYHKNRIYIGFGWNGLDALNDIWYLDMDTKYWHKINTPDTLVRRDSTAASLVGDHIYICGGGVKRTVINEIVKLDTNTNSVVVMSLCEGHICAKPGGSSVTDGASIYIIGGNYDYGTVNIVNNNDEYISIYDTEMYRFIHLKNHVFKCIGYCPDTFIIDNNIVIIQGVHNKKEQNKMKYSKMIKIKFKDSKQEYHQKLKCLGYSQSNIKTDISISFQQ